MHSTSMLEIRRLLGSLATRLPRTKQMMPLPPQGRRSTGLPRPPSPQASGVDGEAAMAAAAAALVVPLQSQYRHRHRRLQQRHLLQLWRPGGR